MRKSKVYTAIGKIEGFTPDLNNGKFPTYKQVDKYLGKETAFFDLEIRDYKTFTDMLYRFKRAGIRDLAKKMDNQQQPRWYDDMKIELHYVKNQNVRIIESSQPYQPKKKLTKAQKKSLASQKQARAKHDKIQSSEVTSMNQRQNSIMAKIAILKGSATYALATKAKSTSQIDQELKSYYVKIKPLMTHSSALPTAKQIKQEIKQNQTNKETSSVDSDVNFGNNMKAKIQALANAGNQNQASATNSTSSANSSATNNKASGQPTKASSDNKSNVSSSVAVQKSLTPKQQSIAEVRAQVQKAKVQQRKRTQQRVRAKAVERVSAEAKKQASAKAKVSASQASTVAEHAKSESQRIESAKEHRTVAILEHKSQKIIQDAMNQNDSSAKPLKKSAKSEVSAQQSNVANHDDLGDLDALLGQIPNEHELALQQAYKDLLHQTHMNHDKFHTAMNKIYKQEKWNTFFKDNEEDAKEQIDKSLDRVFGNISVTYPLDYNVFPDMNQYFEKPGSPIIIGHKKHVKSKPSTKDSIAYKTNSNKSQSHKQKLVKPQTRKVSKAQKLHAKKIISKQSVKQMAQNDKKAHQRLLKERQTLKKLQDQK